MLFKVFEPNTGPTACTPTLCVSDLGLVAHLKVALYNGTHILMEELAIYYDGHLLDDDFPLSNIAMNCENFQFGPETSQALDLYVFHEMRPICRLSYIRGVYPPLLEDKVEPMDVDEE